MTSEESAKDFKDMYVSLTDPDEIEKNRRTAERQKRKEERMADTGAYV